MINIRPVKKEDLPLLAEIYIRVYTVFDVGEKWTNESALELMKYWFAKQPDLAIAAEYDGNLVGAFFSTIRPYWTGNALFDGEVFVDPDFQKKGIGKVLFKKMFTNAIDKYDAKSFCAFTFNGSEYPLNWYKKLGFHEIKEWTIFSGDIRKALIELEK